MGSNRSFNQRYPAPPNYQARPQAPVRNASATAQPSQGPSIASIVSSMSGGDGQAGVQALVALVATVASTAITAITSITAIAASNKNKS
jgi:hypothetical protein